MPRLRRICGLTTTGLTLLALATLAKAEDPTALPAGDRDTLSLVIDGASHEMREVQERFPGPKDPLGTDDAALLKPARAAVVRLVIQLRRIEAAAVEGDQAGAVSALATFRRGVADARPLLAAAAPVSLYNPERLARHQTLVAMVTNR